MINVLEKRERLIQAAIDAFCNKGIDKTTISDIAKLAGVAQGTFYLYFPSKLSIMPAIAEVMVNNIYDGLENNVKGGTFDSQMKEIIDVIFNLTRDYRELSTIIYSGLTQFEDFKSWDDIYSPVHKWMNNFLLKYQEMGIVRSSINTKNTAEIIITLIESTAEQLYLYEKFETNKVSEHKEELFAFLRRGLGIY